jgi:hypothetical protein
MILARFTFTGSKPVEALGKPLSWGVSLMFGSLLSIIFTVIQPPAADLAPNTPHHVFWRHFLDGEIIVDLVAIAVFAVGLVLMGVAIRRYIKL